MKRFFKIIASIIATLALLVILGIIALMILVKPNNFKNQISQEVFNQTGRQLNLQGDLSWSFYPWLGLEINNATLSNKPGFGKEPFLEIKHADVAVKLRALFNKQIEIGKINFDGLVIRLVRNAKGETNWQDLTDNSTNPKLKGGGVPNVDTNDSGARIKLNHIAVVDITNSKISWNDLQKGQNILLSELELRSKNIENNQPFPLDIQFLLQNNQPAINGKVSLKGKIIPNTDQQIFQINDLRFKSNLTGPALPNNKLDLNLYGNVNLDCKNKIFKGQLTSSQIQIKKINIFNVTLGFNSQNNQIDLNPIQGQLYGGAYQGKININLQNKAPVITSTSNLTNVQAEPLFRDLANVTSVKLTGTGNFSTNLTTKGTDSDQIFKNLNGQGKLSLTNGTLRGINIPYLITTGLSLLHKQSLPELPSENQTDFGNLTASYSITNGIVQNNDLLLKSSQIYVTGSGAIDLVKQQINYILNAQLADAATGQPKGDVIPLEVTGPLTKPRVRPSVTSLLKTQIKNQLEKHKDAIGNQLQKFLGKDAGQQIQNSLQNFLNR